MMNPLTFVMLLYVRVSGYVRANPVRAAVVAAVVAGALALLTGCGQSPYRVVCNSNDPELVGEYASFAHAKAVQHETGAAMVCRGSV